VTRSRPASQPLATFEPLLERARDPLRGWEAMPARLEADAVTLAYDAEPVVAGLSLRIPDGQVTSIIGPNGCGKSTLLRALVRLMRPRGGAVYLDGQSVHRLRTKEVARRLGLLPQQSTLPEAITVEDLVRRGRYPHQSFFQQPTARDQAVVERAIELAGVADLRERPVDELSGGQRQRAWIAMVLAQETPVLLLDEPTTYLDIAHQQEVFALVRRLNREEGRTVVMVLHDINDAARVSDHIVAMRDGAIVAEGAPEVVIAPDHLEAIFGVPCDVVAHPEHGTPVCVPRGRDLESEADGARACAIRADRLSSGYGGRRVVNEVTVEIPAGRVTAIVGANACGKSTLLKTLARLLEPLGGGATLDGRPIREGRHRDFARRLAMLAQGPVAPPGVLVEELVAAGRYPYQRWHRQWSADDEAAVERALRATGIEELRWRVVESLSGGQRQRVWVAMALAQDTPVLLLDEPTTFLDIAHQTEVLDLVHELNRREGRTAVMVLHDLAQACRYADYLVAMRDGEVVAAGAPGEVVTVDLVREVFGIDCCVTPDPRTGKPLVLPVPAAGAVGLGAGG
jgi:iron complex transport system ATP-binding protein